MDEKLWCSAEALWRNRQINDGSLVAGIAIPDPIRAEGKDMKMSGKQEMGNKLLESVKIYKYIPAPAEGQYRTCTGKPGLTGTRWVRW